MAARGQEAEDAAAARGGGGAIPDFARRFKATYVAHELHMGGGGAPRSRLVQCHFNIPMTHLHPPNDATFGRVATKITDFLRDRFALNLPVANMQAGYYEIYGVPELQEFNANAAAAAEDDAFPPRKTYFQGTFNLHSGNHCLMWPKQRLESRGNVAESIGLALDQDNVQKCMVTRYHRRNRSSAWVFLRLVALILACVFTDAHSQAALAGLNKSTRVYLA